MCQRKFNIQHKHTIPYHSAAVTIFVRPINYLLPCLFYSFDYKFGFYFAWW